MLKRLILVVVMIASSAPAFAVTSIEKCVAKRVNALRASPEAKQYENENGYEIMIRQEELDEFKSDCSHDKKKKAETAIEKCVTKKVNAMRASPEGQRHEKEMGFEIMITQDQLNEFEYGCKYDKKKIKNK